MRLDVSTVAGLSMLAVLVACPGAGEGEPPEILLGADACNHCRMVISEERHAAAARSDGSEFRFDDPGCLLAWASEQQSEPAGLWVHDVSGSWIVATEAWFVRAPAIVTPMASGVVAFSSAAEAEAAARDHAADVLRWQDL